MRRKHRRTIIHFGRFILVSFVFFFTFCFSPVLTFFTSLANFSLALLWWNVWTACNKKNVWTRHWKWSKNGCVHCRSICAELVIDSRFVVYLIMHILRTIAAVCVLPYLSWGWIDGREQRTKCELRLHIVTKSRGSWIVNFSATWNGWRHERRSWQLFWRPAPLSNLHLTYWS